DVLSLDEQDDIHQALDKFTHVNLMSVPVLNADRELVGTLALYEIVEGFKRAADARAPWEHLVKHIMNRQVVTVQPTQPIQDLVPYFV
ncbi:HPP family protein, partial [Acinetobacter guillouiae]|uniref:CBS domain-containing protein n=1 Tax=Acinetobacter guillouiae TaxID=106649 RepID=UPI003AF5110F